MNSSIIWIGVLPVLAFVIIDAFAEQRKALLGAFILAVGELIFTIVKFKTLDYLTIIAFVLLGVFIAVSLKTKNDFYFKIQGAVINSIFALIILGGKYLLGKVIILDMMVKYIGFDNIEQINPMLNEKTATMLFTAMNSQLPWWFILHSILTVYAAVKWHKWVWVGIRVPGFYLMLFLAAQLIGLTVFT